MSEEHCFKSEHYMVKDGQPLSSRFSDKTNCLNYLNEVLQQDPNTIPPLQFEEILHSMHVCFSTLGCLKSIDDYLKNLETIELQNCVVINNYYKIPIREIWFSKFSLIASMTFYPHLTTCSISHVNKLLTEGMLLFSLEKYESKFLLQLIFKLCDCKQDSKITLQVFYFLQIAALAQHSSLKSIVENIAKKILPYIDKNLEIDFDYLPLRGIPTSQLSHFKTVTCCEIEIIITRIIEMFSNNIHNREAGFLYKLLLNIMEESFWSCGWPYFSQKLCHIDCAGEYFQSLVKYWIPISVANFGSSFYHLTLTSNISNILKGYILLETRKQRRCSALSSDDFKKNDLELLTKLIYKEGTDKLGFQALCWIHLFYKKKVPCEEQLQLVIFFMERQKNCLGSKELKAFEELLLQICDAISKTNVTKDEDIFLKKFLMNMFYYGQYLLKSRRKDLGAQLVNSLWSAISEFEKQEYFTELSQMFNKKSFIQLVDDIWNETQTSYISYPVCDLAISVLKTSNDLLLARVDMLSEAFSIKATESIGNYAQCTIKYMLKNSNFDEKVSELTHRTFTELKSLFMEQDLKSIFKANLLFQILNQTVQQYNHEEWVRNEYFFAIASLLQQKFYQPTDAEYMLTSEWSNIRVEKIVEALYDNICRYLLNKADYRMGDDFTKIMTKLVEIIENSSMRKPTMLSETLLKHYASFYDIIPNKQEKEEFLNFKLQLLKGVLQRLERALEVQNLSIRRHPETRLVIHALCASAASDEKIILTFTLNHLLALLSNPKSTDATIASTLHCTEILISNNSLYDLTLTYTTAVISSCIRHFGNRNWTVRNGSIQLFKALINRFLGVPIGPSNRHRSIVDLCHIFPNILKDLYQALTTEPLNDSALAVLQLFSESQLKVEMVHTELKLLVIESFMNLFVKLINENDLYGLFAARAYVSLCLPHDIPHIFAHITSFIIEKYQQIRHLARNFTLLLQELNDKYLDSIREKRSKPAGYYFIHDKLNVLTSFLSGVNSGQFDLLLIKTLSIEEVQAKFRNSVSFDLNNFQQRVWLHNNIPFLIINVPKDELKYVLKIVLSKNIPEFLQIKVLCILVDRITLSDYHVSIIDELILNALNTLNKASTYLQMSYYKVISLIFSRNPGVLVAKDAVTKIRSLESKRLNIYILFVIIMVLYNLKEKSRLINSALKRFESEMLHGTEDVIESISEILKYVYESSSCMCQKQKVLKLALFIILEHGHWHLINHLTNCFITTPAAAMQQILNFSFLQKYFKSDADAFQFVKEFCEVKCKDKKVSNKNYYVEEDEVFVDEELVRKLVFRFLKDFYKSSNRSEELFKICSKFKNKCF